jgi:hypothetical protein
MGLLMELEKVCDGAPGKGYVCFIEVQKALRSTECGDGLPGIEGVSSFLACF